MGSPTPRSPSGSSSAARRSNTMSATCSSSSGYATGRRQPPTRYAENQPANRGAPRYQSHFYPRLLVPRPDFVLQMPEPGGTMNYDAIVIGARAAGSPTAMLLARKGYDVLAVD